MTRGEKQVISKASPHTVKKFELIEKYIKSWAQKLMLNKYCDTLVYIDCMCNSGVYKNVNDEIIKGTPVRVAEALLDVARKYPQKFVEIYLNDIKEERVNELKKHLPDNERNFKIITLAQDANDFLNTIGPQFYQKKSSHYFLLYDPYDASINWEVLIPFFRNWGEVLINHMVSDPIRAIKCAKKKAAKEKYETTYLAEFEKLVPFGSDKQAYEKRIKDIIEVMKGPRNCYVSAFPFYNRQNTQIYSLVHCTGNIEGFKLYKACAWKVFGGRSSIKNTHSATELLAFNFSYDTNEILVPETDKSCFTVHDIAQYLQEYFSGRKQVNLDEIWNLLDNHPIFPSCFRPEIKKELVKFHGAIKEMIPNSKTGHKEEVISFR